MTAEETREIVDLTSDMNLLHMHQGGDIDYLLEGLFRHTDTLVDGTIKKMVEDMTRFRRIELLERLWGHPGMICHPMLRDIGQFVEEIGPYKEGFRTANDFE